MNKPSEDGVYAVKREPDIEPCPNPECGGTCKIVSRIVPKFESQHDDKPDNICSVYCLECNYFGPKAEGEAEAIRLHNLIAGRSLTGRKQAMESNEKEKNSLIINSDRIHYRTRADVITARIRFDNGQWKLTCDEWPQMTAIFKQSEKNQLIEYAETVFEYHNVDLYIEDEEGKIIRVSQFYKPSPYINSEGHIIQR